MKPGTLVAHRTWGKGIVTEILTRHTGRKDAARAPIRVCWLKPRKRPLGANQAKVTTSVVWQNSVTIISEGE